MVKTANIRPLSEFVRHTRESIDRLKGSGAPEILTVNGEASVVVQDASSYEDMAALAEQARQDARLRSALDYFRDGGKGIAVDDVFAKLEEKYL